MSTIHATDLSELMRSGKYSDLTLGCAGQEFKVHKMIVCSQSPVFAAAVDQPFKESRTGVINIEGFNIETVTSMIEFFYTGDYGSQLLFEVEPEDADGQKSESRTTAETSRLTSTITDHALHHAWVNAIADYYNIVKLAELTRSKIQRTHRDRWDPNACINVTKNALGLTGDETFHDTMALTVARNITELLSTKRLSEVIDDFGLKVLGHCMRIAEANECRLTLQMYRLQEELTGERKRREGAEARADQIIRNIKDCVQSLGTQNYCRNNNCQADFDCFIEQRGQASLPLFTLRCAKCRCRH